MTSAILLSLALLSGTPAAGSICYGTPEKGRLDNGVKLPSSGSNFSTYSVLGSTLGRTAVHQTVALVIIDAYKALETSATGKYFVYGETGWPSGGSFKPHKTHQNGLSVDFMVPVIDASAKSVPLPTSAFNKYGYDIEFTSDGRFGELTIDFEAIAAHIWELDKAAKTRGIKLRRVIFDNELQLGLHKTKHWPYLRDNVIFSRKRPWIRHDEHYHIDFEVKCRQL
jgi:penicillin-insensitive murein DD-endopeptidase